MCSGRRVKRILMSKLRGRAQRIKQTFPVFLCTHILMGIRTNAKCNFPVENVDIAVWFYLLVFFFSLFPVCFGQC